MKLFGWRIISEERYRYYEKCAATHSAAAYCHRWFSGWKDLDIIWDYIFGNQVSGGIEQARKDYAKARGTTVYGVMELNK